MGVESLWFLTQYEKEECSEDLEYPKSGQVEKKVETVRSSLLWFVFSMSIKFSSVTQLSSQNKIDLPFPNFHQIKTTF